MKPITITISDELDRRAVEEARRRGISKSELIREGLERVLPESDSANDSDAWVSLAGFGSPGVSVESGEIDAVVYDR